MQQRLEEVQRAVAAAVEAALAQLGVERPVRKVDLFHGRSAIIFSRKSYSGAAVGYDALL